MRKNLDSKHYNKLIKFTKHVHHLNLKRKLKFNNKFELYDVIKCQFDYGVLIKWKMLKFQ